MSVQNYSMILTMQFPNVEICTGTLLERAISPVETISFSWNNAESQLCLQVLWWLLGQGSLSATLFLFTLHILDASVKWKQLRKLLFTGQRCKAFASNYCFLNGMMLAENPLNLRVRKPQFSLPKESFGRRKLPKQLIHSTGVALGYIIWIKVKHGCCESLWP